MKISDDLKALKLAGLAMFAGVALAIVGSAVKPPEAQAVIIEGYDPTGAFRAVGVDNNGDLLVSIPPAAVFTSTPTRSNTQWVQNSGGSAQLLLAANGARHGELLCNFSTTDVYIASASVTTSGANRGQLLRGGNDACLSLDSPGNIFTGALYGNASGQYNIAVTEVLP